MIERSSVLNDYSLEEFKVKVEGMNITTPLFIAKYIKGLPSKEAMMLVDERDYPVAILSKQLREYIKKGLRPKELRIMEVLHRDWVKRLRYSYKNPPKTVFIAYSPTYSPNSFTEIHTYKY